MTRTPHRIEKCLLSRPLSRLLERLLGLAAGVALTLMLLQPAAAQTDDSPNAALIEQAQSMMRAQDYEQARALLEDALAASPQDAYLTYNLALTHYAQGDYLQAERLFQEADLKTDHEELHGRVLAQLGNIEAHRGRQAVQGDQDQQAIDHFRRAHQLYGSALLRDSGQNIARANQQPVGRVMVAMVIDRAERQLGQAKSVRRVMDRIESLTRVKAQLEEALLIEPDNAQAKKLMEEVDRLLVENLTDLGDEKLADARAELDKPKSKLDKALQAATMAEHTFRDALVVEPDSPELTERVEQATQLASTILTELGKQELEKSEDANRLPQEVQKLESAIGHFEQAVAMDPDNTEAQELQAQTESKLADKLEASGDESVQTAERRPDTPQHVALHRERADEAYTAATELNPDDAALEEKRRDNALELADALEQTGNDDLAEGKEMLEENPNGAVARLEQALEDFTKAGDLLAEHGEPTDSAQAGADEAGEMLAGTGEQDPGDAQAGTEPGEGEADPGDAQASAQEGPGGAEPGDPQSGIEPGQGQAQPGTPQAGAPVPGGSMAARLEASTQQTLALLQQARSAIDSAAQENLAEVGGAGVPSYESVAYVMGGSAFDNEEGGGSNEREGNFNTEAMNRPERDW